MRAIRGRTTRQTAVCPTTARTTATALDRDVCLVLATASLLIGFRGPLLLSAGGFAALAPLPLLMAIALTALEVLVAFLQAYVFTMLTCMYLNDALHPGH